MSVLPSVNLIKTNLEQLFWNIHSSIWDEYFNHPEYQQNMKSLVCCLADKKKQRNERIIDLGCGTGNYSIAFAQLGFSVVGVDFSPKMIQKAREKTDGALTQLIEFQIDNLNDSLPFSANTFDHAICVHVFQALHDPVAFLAQVQKILKPNGYFLILVKNPEKRYESKIKLKKSFTRIIIILLKKVLSVSRTIQKFKKEDLKLLLTTSGFKIVQECPFTGAIGLLAQKKEPK